MSARPFGHGGDLVPPVGQGTWNFGSSPAAQADAIAALRAGIELGLTHIDTAEMYGDGRSERIVAEAIAGLPRERLFLVSKVLPSNASRAQTIRSCETSLRRMKLEYLDAYLLHWRGPYPLEETVSALERLVDDGKIRALGVSNFDVEDIDEARAALRVHPLACNQVLYHLGDRYIERRLLPHCREHGIALVGYSPFGSGDFPGPMSAGGAVLGEIAERHAVSPYAVALAFLVRLEGTFTIPKAADVAHVAANARALALDLSAGDVAAIDRAFPKPDGDRALGML